MVLAPGRYPLHWDREYWRHGADRWRWTGTDTCSYLVTQLSTLSSFAPFHSVHKLHQLIAQLSSVPLSRDPKPTDRDHSVEALDPVPVEREHVDTAACGLQSVPRLEVRISWSASMEPLA